MPLSVDPYLDWNPYQVISEENNLGNTGEVITPVESSDPIVILPNIDFNQLEVPGDATNTNISVSSNLTSSTGTGITSTTETASTNTSTTNVQNTESPKNPITDNSSLNVSTNTSNLNTSVKPVNFLNKNRNYILILATLVVAVGGIYYYKNK